MLLVQLSRKRASRVPAHCGPGARRWRRPGWAAAAAVAALLPIATACGSSSPPSAGPAPAGIQAAGGQSGGTGSGAVSAGGTIKLGFVTDLTGGLGSSFSTTAAGAQALVDKVNATGGVDGRKLQLLVADTASSPTQAVVAIQSLLSRGAFGIITVSGVSPVGSYAALQKQSVPVVGACFDGLEWSDPANSNMFSYMGCNAKLPTTTTWGAFLKQAGVTKMSAVSYADIPTSKALAQSWINTAKSVGLQVGTNFDSVTTDQTNFSSLALSVKSSGSDGINSDLATAPSIALANALSGLGYQPKASVYGQSLYDPSTLTDATTRATLQNAYIWTQYEPLSANTPATRTFSADIKKYGGVSGVPSFGFVNGWLSASLFVAGLQEVGQGTLTRSSYIAAMHHLSGFDADGILPSKINFATRWGQGAQGQDIDNCTFMVQLRGETFYPENGGAPYCGKVIPGDNQGNGAAPVPS
jgi:branched-chain amino acid transport system substrate-binding protein